MKARSLILAISILAFSLVGFGARPAHAETMTCDSTMEATVASLRNCVVMAYQMQHIDSFGVEQALLNQLDAAQAALDHGQPVTAANILYAFILTVQAQSGAHIQAEHAAHMVMHAQMVIEAITDSIP